jgi:hypothetical protein
MISAQLRVSGTALGVPQQMKKVQTKIKVANTIQNCTMYRECLLNFRETSIKIEQLKIEPRLFLVFF